MPTQNLQFALNPNERQRIADETTAHEEWKKIWDTAQTDERGVDFPHEKQKFGTLGRGGKESVSVEVVKEKAEKTRL